MKVEEDVSMQEDLERVVKSVGIPPRPSILLKLADEAAREDPDLSRVGKLISTDVALSAALMKTVNSPFYGLRHSVPTIHQALQFLGLRTVTELVTCLILRRIFSGPAEISLERFWDVSAQVALLCSHLSREFGVGSWDEAYTYGLFQDCGIAVMAQRFEGYKETLVLANAERKRPFTSIEDERHSLNHAVVGGMLAREWGLSDTACRAIRRHHLEFYFDQDEIVRPGSRKLVGLALLAEHTLQVCYGRAQTKEWEKTKPRVLHELGIAEDKFDGRIPSIKTLLEAAQ